MMTWHTVLIANCRCEFLIQGNMIQEFFTCVLYENSVTSLIFISFYTGIFQNSAANTELKLAHDIIMRFWLSVCVVFL